jgi:hypothetical protein
MGRGPWGVASTAEHVTGSSSRACPPRALDTINRRYPRPEGARDAEHHTPFLM